MKVTALVPMRHSSERVPGKNYRDFNGRPLFHHIVETLLAAPSVSRVVINTDSDLIAEECTAHFPTVDLILRPNYLLGGEVPMTEILRHDAALLPTDWYLQTHSTNPLLRPETVERAISALESGLRDYDSLFSVTRLQTRLYDSRGGPINHDPRALIRTQDLDPVYEENSNIYLFTRAQIESGRRFGNRPLLFEMNPIEALDIDEEQDFLLAEMAHRLHQEKP